MIHPMKQAMKQAGGNRLDIVGLPAFHDNYLWLVHDGHDAAVVDPGDAAVVRSALDRLGLQLRAILITHHHPDHVGGVLALKAATGAQVWGPRAEARKIQGLDHLLDDGDSLTLDALHLTLSVLAVPGHTLGHIAYHAAADSLLFCGDTLFSAGCGRLFEGTAAQMHASLQRLAALPDQTRVYCAHEYTLANLAFACSVEPGNAEVAAARADVRDWRSAGKPSVPSTLAKEKTINPFLRCDDPKVCAAASTYCGAALADPAEVFAALREWKDHYRAA